MSQCKSVITAAISGVGSFAGAAGMDAGEAAPLELELEAVAGAAAVCDLGSGLRASSNCLCVHFERELMNSTIRRTPSDTGVVSRSR
jgi:hypothetical protein